MKISIFPPHTKNAINLVRLVKGFAFKYGNGVLGYLSEKHKTTTLINIKCCFQLDKAYFLPSLAHSFILASLSLLDRDYALYFSGLIPFKINKHCNAAHTKTL